MVPVCRHLGIMREASEAGDDGPPSADSRDRIAYESKARRPAGDVYAVAKETPSAESHAHAAQVSQCVLESGQRGGIVVSELAIHARPLIGPERYSQGKVSRRRLQLVSDRVCPPAIELVREVVMSPL